MTDATLAYRRLTGLLLLWALLPLPFLYLLLPPFWLAGGVVGALLLLRPRLEVRLGTAAQNLLGVVILVVVLAVGGWNVGPLRPFGHLLILLASLRGLLVRDRGSFLRTLPLLFLIWVVSTTSSTHVAAVGYLAASTVLWWWAGMRVHLLGLSPSFGAPRLGHVAPAAFGALLLAIPVFVVMPRLTAPVVAGGRGPGSMTGFSTSVDLSGAGAIQLSRQLVAVVRAGDGGSVDPDWTPLRATVFDQIHPGTWTPRVRFRRPVAAERGPVRLTAGEDLSDTREVRVDLLEHDRYLFLPRGTVAVDAPVPLALDPTGGVVINRRMPSDRRIEYRVWVADEPSRRLTPPDRRDLSLSVRDPRVAALAQRIAGGLGPRQAAQAIEQRLQREYRYTLDAGGGFRRDPIGFFLLEGREGHCEYFAGAMVVLLRHLGVPARMVTGFAGGDLAPAGDELVVTRANAHAWVEVWEGAGRGWVEYDPTPVGGVPGVNSLSGWQRAAWLWEQAELGFDRFLLTFGFAEQVALLDAAAGTVRGLVLALLRPAVGWGLVGLLGAAGLLRLALSLPRLRHAVSGPASRTVHRLGRALAARGEELPSGATVRRIGGRARRVWPGAAAHVAELVRVAELELYAPTPAADRRHVRRLWNGIRRSMR